jgi:acyl carrier protein
MSDLVAKVRAIVGAQARLTKPVATLGDRDDLFAAGMSSHASVNVMLALETELGVEFADHMLTRDVFTSIASLAAAVASLTTA